MSFAHTMINGLGDMIQHSSSMINHTRAMLYHITYSLYHDPSIVESVGSQATA